MPHPFIFILFFVIFFSADRPLCRWPPSQRPLYSTCGVFFLYGQNNKTPPFFVDKHCFSLLKKQGIKRKTLQSAERSAIKKTEDVAHLLMYGPTRGSSSRPPLAPLLTAFQFAAVSGQEAEEAVVSRSTGHVFEKRLIEKYLAANDRRCPVTGQTLDADDLLPLKGTAPTVNLAP
jgi:hypothetical protein